MSILKSTSTDSKLTYFVISFCLNIGTLKRKPKIFAETKQGKRNSSSPSRSLSQPVELSLRWTHMVPLPPSTSSAANGGNAQIKTAVWPSLTGIFTFFVTHITRQDRIISSVSENCTYVDTWFAMIVIWRPFYKWNSQYYEEHL